MVGTHHRVARRARRDARKVGRARAVGQVKGLFAAASAARKRLSRERRAAKAAQKKVARAAAAEARRRRAAARKASKARRAGVRAARKAAKAAKPLKIKAVGTKAEVYKGLAKHTSGGLKQKDIVRKAVGRSGTKTVYRYMSKKKAAAGKRRGLPKALMAWRSALRRVGAKGVPKKGTSAYRAAKVEYAKIMRKSASVGKAAKSGSRRRRSA